MRLLPVGLLFFSLSSVSDADQTCLDIERKYAGSTFAESDAESLDQLLNDAGIDDLYGESFLSFMDRDKKVASEISSYVVNPYMLESKKGKVFLDTVFDEMISMQDYSPTGSMHLYNFISSRNAEHARYGVLRYMYEERKVSIDEIDEILGCFGFSGVDHILSR